MKTGKSEMYFEKSRQLVPGGVHSPVRSFKGLHTTPRFIKSANGAYIKDEDDNTYIDFCMSFGPLILGHQNPQVKEAIVKALENGWTYGACERYSLEVAEYMNSRIPHAEQIRFMNSGTEAVMTAVRLARGYTSRNKIIKFNGCYHGHLDSMLIKAGSGLAGTATASSKGVTENVASQTLICELADLDSVKQCFEQYPNDIAGIFIEPLPANNGILLQTKEFLQGLRDLCNKYGALLVFDEVISGFRVAFGGMAELTGIIPDIVTYGKIIGGGMPVGAVAGKKAIMQSLAPVGPVYQAGTLSANPVAMAAGLANMQQLTPKFYQQLEATTKKITAVFTKWMNANGFEDYKIVEFQSLFWPVPNPNNVELNNINKLPNNINERFYTLFEILLKKGIYLSPNAYEIGFASAAHFDNVIADLEQRLWSK